MSRRFSGIDMEPVRSSGSVKPFRLVTTCAILYLGGCAGLRTGDSAATIAASTKLAVDLESTATEYVAGYDVPGVAIAVVEDGIVTLSKGLGLANVTEGTPISPETVFNVGSIAKSISVWGILKLVESGMVDLDAPISTYTHSWSSAKSEFADEDLTLRRLLSHTSGVRYVEYLGYPLDVSPPELSSQLAGSGNALGIALDSDPGSRFLYSNGNYALAQSIAEDVADKPFPTYMADTVLLPLGMRRSTFLWNEPALQTAATPYDVLGSELHYVNYSACAAAGFQTTLNDLTIFAMAQLNPAGRKSPISESLVHQTRTPVDPAKDYGLGLYSVELGGVRVITHAGSTPGWSATFALVPEKGDALVVLTNSTAGEPVARAIQCDWLFATTGERCPLTPELPMVVDASVIEHVAGRYLMPDGSTVFDFRSTSGVLAIHVGDRWLRAYPRSTTEFFVPINPVLSFRFELDESGGEPRMSVRSGSGAWAPTQRLD